MSRFQFLLGSLAVAAALAAGPVSARQATDARDLAAAVQQRYERIRDFRADFTHEYAGGVLGRKTVERGEVVVRKPGRMRWTYTSPERKVFVSDGVKLYSYVPADRQVYVASVPGGEQASTPALFLAGQGNLTRDFTVTPSEAPKELAGTVALELTPRTPEREYESLLLVVDRESLQWRRLVTRDRQGGTSTFSFTNLRENTGVPDIEFVFKIPRGVDVITEGER
jgi:outer membrane lipoprotein carrier protein